MDLGCAAGTRVNGERIVTAGPLGPDDLLVAAVRSALSQVPSLDPKSIEDAIVELGLTSAEAISAAVTGRVSGPGSATTRRPASRARRAARTP